MFLCFVMFHFVIDYLIYTLVNEGKINQPLNFKHYLFFKMRPEKMRFIHSKENTGAKGIKITRFKKILLNFLIKGAIQKIMCQI